MSAECPQCRETPSRLKALSFGLYYAAVARRTRAARGERTGPFYLLARVWRGYRWHFDHAHGTQP